MKLLILASLVFCLGATAGARAMDLEVIKLPEAEKSGGITLAEALAKRKSSRDFADTDPTPQQLSNLLWSTAGVNRPDGKKVYPVARNRHDMTVYVFLRQGAYRYDPAANTLIPVVEGDRRAETGSQPFVGKAAVNLLYVQDMSHWLGEPEEGKQLGFAHAGEMAQSAYLFAAGQDWAAVVRGLVDREAMKKLLNLPEDHHVRLAHSIGPRE